MFRGGVLLMLAVVALCMMSLAYNGFMAQETMARQLTAMTADLSALAERQRQLMDRQIDPAAHSIDGVLYMDNEHTTPAAGADVTIRELPSLEIVRRVKTGADGKFASGTLPAGEYCVLSPLVGKGNPEVAGSAGSYPGADEMQPYYATQSAPIIVPGPAEKGPVLVVGLRTARLELAIDKPFRATVGPHDEVPVTLMVRVTPVDLIRLPWTPKRELPAAWPVFGTMIDMTSGYQSIPLVGKEFPWTGHFGQNMFHPETGLRAGRYAVSAVVSLDTSALQKLAGEFGNEWAKAFVQAHPYNGMLYQPMYAYSPKAEDTIVELDPAVSTRLVFEPPNEYFEALQAAFNNPATTVEEYKKLPGSQGVKIEVERE